VAVETKKEVSYVISVLKFQTTHLEIRKSLNNDTVQHILFVEAYYTKSEYQIAFSCGFSAL